MLAKINQYLETVSDLVRTLPTAAISQFADIIYQAYRGGHMFFCFGNGGSAACASHFIEDVAKGIDYGPGRPRYRALALTDSVPLITAWANDADYSRVFAEQLRNFVQPGDVAMGISASGNSPNVLEALRLANQVGATSLSLGGYDGGQMKEIAQHIIIVPSFNMQQVEDVHLVLCHLVYVCLRDRGT